MSSAFSPAIHLVECGHCPHASNRWVVSGAHKDVLASVDEHVHYAHAKTGQWIEGDDWAVLNETDVLAIKAAHDQMHQADRSRTRG